MCFSQDKKFYVQNSMDENAMLIWGLLEKGAHVYVCGFVI